MVKPIILVNFKTYHEGRKALSLAKAIEGVDKTVIVAVNPTDIHLISSETKLPVFSEHVDSCEPGRNTGFLTIEAIKAAGAIGTLLNHSEHPLAFETLKNTVERCKKQKIKTAVFAGDIWEALRIKDLAPDYLIIEPPELVAGDLSVSKARPDLIKEISEKLSYPFLVGAGIKTKEDIDIAIRLGASGVAFASVVTTAKNPRRVLKGMLT